MKYIIVLFTTFIAIISFSQNKNMIIKDAKTAETLFKDTSKYKTANNTKYIKDITIEGFVDKIGITNQSIQAKKSRWVLILIDNTQVWIETKLNLNNLYKKRVQMTGDLVDKTDMHLVKSISPAPPQEGKYRFIAMQIMRIK